MKGHYIYIKQQLSNNTICAPALDEHTMNIGAFSYNLFQSELCIYYVRIYRHKFPTSINLILFNI